MMRELSRSGTRGTWLSLLLVMSLVVMGVAAQNPGSQPKQPASNALCPMCQQMAGGTMPQHEQMGKLIDQLAKSAAALEKETNPTALKKMLAEHASLVRALRTKFDQNSQMMQQMMGQMGQCPMDRAGGSQQ